MERLDLVFSMLAVLLTAEPVDLICTEPGLDDKGGRCQPGVWQAEKFAPLARAPIAPAPDQPAKLPGPDPTALKNVGQLD